MPLRIPAIYSLNYPLRVYANVGHNLKAFTSRLNTCHGTLRDHAYDLYQFVLRCDL